MKPLHMTSFALLLSLLTTPAFAQETTEEARPTAEEPAATEEIVDELAAAAAAILDDEPETFTGVVRSTDERLQAATDELNALKAEMAEALIPMNQRMSKAESERSRLKSELQVALADQGKGAGDLLRLTNDIKRLKDTNAYLNTLLSNYSSEFEASLHIVERQRHFDVLQAHRDSMEDLELAEIELIKRHIEILTLSIDRLEEALGGARFEGTAVVDGLVEDGEFLLVGPAALFRSEGGVVGTAEERTGSEQPSMVAFATPEDAAATEALYSGAATLFPLDPTQGNAHAVAATEETLIDEFYKGGSVMYPIVALATCALLVALYKWLTLSMVRKPSNAKVTALMEAVANGDREGAKQVAVKMGGPAGQMLGDGVDHLGEPRELVEEVMYETVLTSRLKLNRLLPFIAVSAASAPLLGLLGTVTGIINTFKNITIYGSGDVKMLSGGISEALLTTKFGLIIAIPSLLLHAFLSRKARGIINRMEQLAMAFANQMSRSTFYRTNRTEGGGASGSAEPDPDLVREQVNEILGDMLGPLVEGQGGGVQPTGPQARRAKTSGVPEKLDPKEIEILPRRAKTE